MFGKTLTVLAVALALTGCISSGTMVTDDQARQFKPGVTTEADVIDKLGEPNARTVKPDGGVIVTYIYTHATANAASYVPVVSLFAAGAHGQTLSVMFSFDRGGIFENYTSTTANTEVRTGIINGAH